MEKDKIISKLNIKDYNKELEDILTQKSFSEDVKNLLLSMLYKIENSYKDYKKIKVNVPAKKEMLEELLEIIKNVNGIKLSKITDENKNEKKDIVLEEERKIIAIPRESRILYLLYMLKEESTNSIYSDDPLVKRFLKQGKAMNTAELVRDFDGWSWNVNIDELDNIFCNFIYQSINILMNLDSNEKKQDLFKETPLLIKQKKLRKTLNQMIIINAINQDKKEIANVQKEIKEIGKELNKLSDGDKYLERITNKRISLEKKVEKIDKILNNDRLLKQEYIKTNEKLDQNKRIFSLSDYSEILEDEKTKLLEELEEYYEKQNPDNYLKEKEKLLERYNMLTEINLDDTNNNNDIIFHFIKDIVYVLTSEIMATDNKKAIIEYIYKIRYYKLLQIDAETKVKDIKSTNLFNLEKSIITKACNLKIMNILSKSVNENYKIVSKILDKRIIDLEKVQIEAVKEDNKIVFNIYDDKAIEGSISFTKVEELNIKYNKKIPLFI